MMHNSAELKPYNYPNSTEGLSIPNLDSEKFYESRKLSSDLLIVQDQLIHQQKKMEIILKKQKEHIIVSYICYTAFCLGLITLMLLG